VRDRGAAQAVVVVANVVIPGNPWISAIYRTALMADVATGGPPRTGTRIAGILEILEIAE